MKINQISSLFSNYCDYGLKGNPDEDLKTLGMTKEEARAKFGDTQKPEDSSVFEVSFFHNNGSSTLADYFDIVGEAYAEENEGSSDNGARSFFGDIISKFKRKPDFKELNPDTFAQSYADENGISSDEAKSELEKQFGKADPEKYAQEYASVYNMTLEEARAELKAKYGDPAAKTDSTNNTEDSSSENTDELTAKEQELMDKGIPVDVIKQGNDAIRKYAKDHNIELKNPK